MVTFLILKRNRLFYICILFIFHIRVLEHFFGLKFKYYLTWNYQGIWRLSKISASQILEDLVNCKNSNNSDKLEMSCFVASTQVGFGHMHVTVHFAVWCFSASCGEYFELCYSLKILPTSSRWKAYNKENGTSLSSIMSQTLSNTKSFWERWSRNQHYHGQLLSSLHKEKSFIQ